MPNTPSELAERIDRLELMIEVLISILPTLSNRTGDEAYWERDDVRSEQEEIYA